MLPAPDMWGLRRPANVLVWRLGRQLHRSPVKSITDTLIAVARWSTFARADPADLEHKGGRGQRR